MRWSAGRALGWVVAAVVLAILVVSVVRVQSCRKAREGRLDEILGLQ